MDGPVAKVPEAPLGHFNTALVMVTPGPTNRPARSAGLLLLETESCALAFQERNRHKMQSILPNEEKSFIMSDF
jgi:hypothetical protein